jgi:hypothetical protein
MNPGVRPTKLWHWIAIITLGATFLHEPYATLGLAWTLTKGAGQLGGDLLTHQPDNPTNDPTNTDPATTDPAAPDTPENDNSQEGQEGDESAAYRVDGSVITRVLDTGLNVVLDLHDEVTNAQDHGGFTVEVGTGGSAGDHQGEAHDD